jgi:anaerobic selenocysteine-containing dehydrogenase
MEKIIFKMKDKSIYFNTCSRDCYDTCSILTYVKNGRIIRIEGRKDHPITKGFLCSKAKKFINYTYSKDRILYPMKRIGNKGSGKFKRIDWDEALKIISKKIKEIIEKYGSKAILQYNFAGNMGIINRFFPYRFFNFLGTSRIKENICDSAGETALKYVYGSTYGAFPHEILKSKLIIYWGINAAWTNIHGFNLAIEARKKGAKIYVIDPNFTATAKAADFHFKIKPCTDAALALGLANYIIQNNLYDKKFIEENVYGFNEFKEYVKKYDLNKTSEITGIKKEDIINLANNYASLKPNIIHIGYGLQRNFNGGEIVRAISLLPALIGEARGFIYSNNLINLNYVKGEWLRKEKAIEYDMAKLGEVLSNKEIKIIFIYNANPLATLPNYNLVKKSFQRKDLFVIVHDIFKTDTADYADILLPATTFFEDFDINYSYFHNFISINEKVIEPRGEAKSNYELFKLLAKYLNIENEYLYEDKDKIIEKILKENNLEIKLNELKERGFFEIPIPKKNIYQTNSGKIEFYSIEAFKNGLNPFPIHLEINKNNSNLMQLFTTTHKDLTSSQYHNKIKKEIKFCILINYLDAKRIGLKNGDKVLLKNNYGSLKARIKITKDIHEGTLLMYKSPWPKIFKGTPNSLIPDNIQEKYGGCSIIHSTFVTIEKL